MRITATKTTALLSGVWLVLGITFAQRLGWDIGRGGFEAVVLIVLCFFVPVGLWVIGYQDLHEGQQNRPIPHRRGHYIRWIRYQIKSNLGFRPYSWRTHVIILIRMGFWFLGGVLTLFLLQVLGF
jgi:hypothetical protein